MAKKTKETNTPKTVKPITKKTTVEAKKSVVTAPVMPKKEVKTEKKVSKKEMAKEIKKVDDKEIKLFKSVDDEETISFTFKKPFFFFLVFPFFFFVGLFLFLSTVLFAKNSYKLGTELNYAYSVNDKLNHQVTTLENVNTKNEAVIKNLNVVLEKVTKNFENMHQVVNTTKNQLIATANSLSTLE